MSVELEEMTEFTTDGLIINEITIYKFGSYQGEIPVTFQIKGTLIEIVGENGSGKSTIIDALTFALFRSTTRTDKGISIKDFCSINGYVSLKFEKNRNRYKVTRKRENERNFSLKVKENDTFIKGGINEVGKKLIKIIGLNYDAFVNTAIVRQEEAKKLGDVKNSERATILENIYRLNIYGKAEKKVIEDRKELSYNLNILRERISVQKENTSILDDLVINLNDKKKNIKILVKNITSITDDINKKKNEKETFTRSEQSYQTINGQLEFLNSTIKSTENDLMILNKPNNKDKSLWIENIKNLDYFKNKLENIKEIDNNIEKIHDYENRIYNIKLEYQEKIKKSEFETKSMEFDTHEILDRYKEDIATYNNVWDTFESEILGGMKGNLEKEMNKKIIKETTQIKKIIKVNQEIQKKYDIKKSDTIRSVKKEIQKSEESQKKLNEFDLLVDKYNESYTKLNLKIKELYNNKKEFEEKIKILEDHHIGFIEIDAIISTLQNKKNMLTHSTGSLRGEIKTLIKNINTIKEIKKKIVENIDKEKKMETKLRILDILREKVFHTRGVSSYVMATLLEDLGDEASIILRQLTSHRSKESETSNLNYQNISFIIETDAKRRKYGVDISVDGRPIAEFSGGERTMIATAIRLAMARQLSKSLGNSIGVVFIDEGDIGSLDDQSRKAFATMIEGLRSNFKNIILITHIQGITESFDQTINIYRDENNNSNIR